MAFSLRSKFSRRLDFGEVFRNMGPESLRRADNEALYLVAGTFSENSPYQLMAVAELKRREATPAKRISWMGLLIALVAAGATIASVVLSL